MSLGLYIIWKSPYLMISKMLVITMSLLTIIAVFLFLIANAPDDLTAGLFARTIIFVSTLVAISFVYLSSFLPYERRDSWALQHRDFFIIVSVLLALIPAALIDKIYLDQYGYWLDYSPAIILWLGLMLVVCLIPIYVLTPIYRRSTDIVVRRHVVVMSLGVMLPISFVIAELIAEEAGVLMPHISAVGLLLTGILFSVAVLRLKLFIIEPVKEDKLEAQPGKDSGIKLVSGHCDLIKSKKADLSYRMFVAEVAAGNKGLLITRVHPDQVREKYGLVKTPILWLSGQPGPDRLDPASLSILQHTVVDFLQKGSTSVILLDGLEYLVSENQVDKVLRFIYTVHDAVVISGSKFIVPVDPEILGSKDMALFEKEFVVIEEPSE